MNEHRECLHYEVHLQCEGKLHRQARDADISHVIYLIG